MHPNRSAQQICSICGRAFPARQVAAGALVRDYQVDLKAELEIRHLHEKVDHLLSHQWERLVRIQELQLELLTELGRRK
jgi:uncharacterized membrane protein